MHKHALFADDQLLFDTSPLTTLPNIMRLLHRFGEIIGLYVNSSKSLALNIKLFISSLGLKVFIPFNGRIACSHIWE